MIQFRTKRTKTMMRFSALLVFSLLLGSHVSAQSSPADTTGKMVEWVNSQKYRYEKKDSLTELNIWTGNVIVKQNKTTFYCDSAILNKRDRTLEAFGNVHINDADSIHTYSQYLLYYIDTRIANLKKKVKLTDGKITLHTEEMRYDANEKIGDYYNGGRVENGKSVLTSQEGTYYGEMKDVYFKKNVVLKDPGSTVKTDSLLYNTETEVSTFISRTHITDTSGRTIETQEGSYDVKNRKAYFAGRPIITDSKARTRIIANQIDRDDHTGISVLTGNAVYVDSAQGISILANYIKANSLEGTFFATRQPLMIIKQESDSIYIAADTLFSGRLSKLQKQLDSVAAVNAARDSAAKAVAAQRKQALKDSTAIALINNRKGIEKDTTLLPGNLVDSIMATRIDSTYRNNDSMRTLVKQMMETKPGDSAVSITPDTGVKAPVTVQTHPVTIKPPVTVGKPPADTLARPKTAAPKKGKDPVIITDTTKSNDSTDRYFQAFHNVRIFSDSLQAVADSLFYSGKDSIFRLFTDPVVWNGDSQITGDTIYMYTKNKKPEKVFVFENALAVSKTGENMFNQLKGNRITAMFIDGNIDYVRAKGNAESVYWAKDEDSALVGINNAHGDIIDLRFLNKELDKIVIISAPTAGFLPVSTATEQEKVLRNFKWLDKRRPKTKFELFGN